jgi:hypothetical protein
MAASDIQALDAIAFQLVAALERYEASTETLVSGWPDMDGYRVVSAGIDEIRMYSAALPTLSVQFVTLLIAHAELIHCLWKLINSPAADDGVARALDQHRASIAGLRTKALRLMSPPADLMATRGQGQGGRLL